MARLVRRQKDHGKRNPVPSEQEYGEIMKQEASFFEDREAVLVYIAKKLNDALRLESIFTAAGVDYGVETDEYHGGVVFQSARVGAFFYVLPETLGAAHQAMESAGFKPHRERA